MPFSPTFFDIYLLSVCKSVVFLAILLTGCLMVSPPALAKRDCPVPKDISALTERVIGNDLRLLDRHPFRWTPGKPPLALGDADGKLIDESGGTFAWAKADVDGDGREEWLVQTTLLQGRSATRYRLLHELHMLCGAPARLCATFGLWPNRFMKNWLTGANGKWGGEPSTNPVRLGVITNRLTPLLAVIAQRATKAEIYQWRSATELHELCRVDIRRQIKFRR